jgi:hypothetical protein
MSDSNDNSVATNSSNTTPPVLRNAGIAEATIVAVDSGRLAVTSQLTTQKDVDENANNSEREDEAFQGVVDVNHTDIPGSEQAVEEPEIIEAQAEEAYIAEPQPVEKLETVNNKYIPSEPYEPTGNDPYPKRPPLLAPN